MSACSMTHQEYRGKAYIYWIWIYQR